jgi:hypothetical protein
MFEPENRWTDYDEISFGHYYGIAVKNCRRETSFLLSFTQFFFQFLKNKFFFFLLDSQQVFGPDRTRSADS